MGDGVWGTGKILPFPYPIPHAPYPVGMIEAYHGLLTPEIAEASHAHLEGVLRKKGLVFGDRPLCTVLRPRLMTAESYAGLQSQVIPLLRAFRRIHERAVADAEFRKQFRLTDWEEVLFASDPGYSRPSPTSRLDFFAVPGSQS